MGMTWWYVHRQCFTETLYEANFKGIICPAGSMWIITVPSFPQRVSAALLNQFTKSARVCGILFNSRSEIPWSTYRQFVPIYPSAPRTFSQGGNKDEECPRTTTCRGSSLHFAWAANADKGLQEACFVRMVSNNLIAWCLLQPTLLWASSTFFWRHTWWCWCWLYGSSHPFWRLAARIRW